jgi:carbon-monoxide dehydrogenase large subunit
VSCDDPPNLTFPFGAYLCVVDIDKFTGETKVRRFYALDECGTRIDPMIIEGQIHGGLTEAFAVGMGQQVPFDENGNHLGNSLTDYFLPTAVETPHWETAHTVTPCPHHPIGAKGVAESPHVVGIPCFSNAVIDALAHLNVTHMDMPHSAYRVWKKLNELGSTSADGARARAVPRRMHAHARARKRTSAPASAECADPSPDDAMKVQLDKTFDLPGPAAAGWAVLSDIERVAACMPGARITERVDDTHYKGTVAVKFGPANMSLRGEIEVATLDAATHTLRLVGKGTDTTGSSGASMDLTARIEAVDSANSRLVGSSETSMSGKAATFGGRMAGAVANQVLAQFGANFAAQVQAIAASVAAATAAAAAPAQHHAAAAAGATAPSAQAPAAAAAAMAAAPPSTGPAPAPAATQLNALALAWAVFKDWLRSIFAPRKA